MHSLKKHPLRACYVLGARWDAKETYINRTQFLPWHLGNHQPTLQPPLPGCCKLCIPSQNSPLWGPELLVEHYLIILGSTSQGEPDLSWQLDSLSCWSHASLSQDVCPWAKHAQGLLFSREGSAQAPRALGCLPHVAMEASACLSAAALLCEN